MIRIIVTALGILFSYLLQSSVFMYFELANVVPDIIIILIITVGYTKGQLYGMFTGLLSGLLIDFCMGTYVGALGILYMLIGYIAGYSYKIYDKDDYTLPILFIGVGEFLYQHMYYLLFFVLRGKNNYLYFLKRFILPKTIYTVAVGIILYKLFHSIHRFLLRIEHKEE